MDVKRRRQYGDIESSVDTARLLMLLTQHGATVGVDSATPAGLMRAHSRVFECKTCSRRYPTFQALGGHRASHKRRRLHALGDAGAGLCLGGQTPAPAAGGPRVHECPVCGVELAVGQALGGHMRRHRTAAAEAGVPDAAATVKNVDEDGDVGGVCMDLNLTPSENCAKCRNARLAAAAQRVHKALILDCSL